MSVTSDNSDAFALQIDIVSDVMCPWCIVGFKQLEHSLEQTGTFAHIRWHPFELNPEMPPQGQNLAAHIAQKYGSTPAQSAENRARITQLGQELGFDFNFTQDSRIVNTFAAHQLLDWAEAQDMQHPLKLAFFSAYFTHGRDVSDHSVLCAVAGEVGLDTAAAAEILKSGSRADHVRKAQSFWTSRGISSVPSVVFGQKYLLTGAQGVQTYAEIIKRVRSETAAPQNADC
ncbi:MAG: DsbA family oxidoreductase [Sulfitobacter sp.]